MSSDSRHSIVASPVTAAIPLLVWCHRAAWRTIFFILRRVRPAVLQFVRGYSTNKVGFSGWLAVILARRFLQVPARPPEGVRSPAQAARALPVPCP